MENSIATRPASIRWHHFAGITLLSFATLLLELSLTRVLSVASWYHFGFLVISTALLGFGVSGVVLSLWKNLRDSVPLDSALSVISLIIRSGHTCQLFTDATDSVSAIRIAERP